MDDFLYALVLLVMLSMISESSAQKAVNCILVPDYNPQVYSVAGDINIGGIAIGRDYSNTERCAPGMSNAGFVQASAAIAYAASEITDDKNLLPNLTVGYFITETCFNRQTSLAAALNFVEPGVCNVSSAFPTPDVVGVVGVTTSSSAASYGLLLSTLKVPMVGAVSTSESLSDKTLFKYFVRVVPSDFYQAKAMMSIILLHNWTFISTIYSEGDYGRKGIRAVHDLAEENDVCIAYSFEIRRGSTEEVFVKIAKGLIKNRAARLVVLFTQPFDAEMLLTSIKNLQPISHFIILGSDGLALGFNTGGIEELIHGSMYISPSSIVVPKYKESYSTSSIATNPDPWLKVTLSTLTGCSWDAGSAMKQCDPNLMFKDTPLLVDSFVVPLTIDSVYALAHATHDYIADKCPKAFEDPRIVKSCVKRHEILPYLYSVQFIGSTGETVRFDQHGDIEGRYDVLKALKTENGGIKNKVVGFWDKLTSSLTLTERLLWSDGQLSGSPLDIPESVCSKPCKAGEFLIQLEQICCWECRRCRKNEIVVRNGSSCDECELLTWPNQEHFLTCDTIDPALLKWTEAQTLAVLILGAFGLAFSFLMVVLFTKYRHQRLIKATSRELSMITLAGVILSYAAAFILLSKPTTATCYAGRFCFNLSFGIAYAPLLAKVTRIHRIFAAAKHGTKAPSFVSTRSQVFLSVMLILIQVILSVVSVILYPPDVTLSMPLINEPFVEMLCFLPIEALTYSLTYNLVLMLACSLFAFKTRRLPDNFNESKFIFVCVCTTLFLWLAFIPSYFSAFYASQKIILLVIVLLFNSAVMLLMLYMPRIYAVIYLIEEKQGISATATQVGTTTTQVPD